MSNQDDFYYGIEEDDRERNGGNHQVLHKHMVSLLLNNIME